VAAGAANDAGGNVSGSAAALQARHGALRAKLERSPFGKPLHLESTEADDRLQGDIHAVVEQPFERVRTGLGDVRNWCDILVLHPNITGCSATAAGGSNGRVTIEVGRQGTPVEFVFRLRANDADYMHARLSAQHGPLGTTDYRIDLEATPLDRGRTILHLVYAHGFGAQARFAMRAYLGTFGRGKVGFTVVDRGADGQPLHVGDFRGALERNAMRYYLCIDAYLQSLAEPPAQQFEKRLQTWFAYTKRYPRQLREDPQYLEAKRELSRSMHGAGSPGRISDASAAHQQQ
jgi:hypothetical protein